MPSRLMAGRRALDSTIEVRILGRHPKWAPHHSKNGGLVRSSSGRILDSESSHGGSNPSLTALT